MKHSDYSLIPTFVAVVEEKNYTRAAKKLGISQSAVSQNVARLREIYKDNLFIRGSHGVVPTQFAQDLFPTLSTAVESIAFTLPQHTRFRPEEFTKRFTISALSVMSYTMMPKLSSYFAQHAPLASVKVDPLVGLEPADLLRSQQNDLLIDVHTNYYSHLRREPLLADTLKVICQKDHPRLTGDTITREQFLAEKHVGHSMRGAEQGYLLGRGVVDEELFAQRKIAWHASNMMEAVPLIAQSDYLALMPARLVNDLVQYQPLKALDGEFLQQPIGVDMYWHPSRTNDPSHKWLRNAVKTVAKDV